MTPELEKRLVRAVEELAVAVRELDKTIWIVSTTNTTPPQKEGAHGSERPD